MAEKTIMQQLLDAGYPREEVYHHESDLYVYVNCITKPIVEQYYSERGRDISRYAPIFTDQVTGRAMYDIAFGYDDWLKDRKQEEDNMIAWLNSRYGKEIAHEKV